MAKIDFDYLSRKYSADEQFQEMIKDKDYLGVMHKVFDLNSKQINDIASQTSRSNWEEMVMGPAVPRGTTAPTRYKMPDMETLLPEREQIYKRAFSRASKVAAKIRTDLADKLRESIAEFEGKHGTKTFLNNRINPKLEETVSDNIEKILSAYTKKHPKVNMPPNVYGMAVTEVRSAINNSKAAVAGQIKEMNPELPIKKEWIHNPHLSLSRENIREGHKLTNGKILPIQELFKVPLYRRVNGVPVKVGESWMEHPHDVDAPAEQTVNCHCDIRYFI